MMAMIAPSSSLQLTNHHFRCPRAPFLHRPHAPALIRASTETDSSTKPEPEPSPGSVSDPDQFDARLARVRYRSGTGKKAELRKVKKGKKVSGSGAGMYMPPVALKEPVSGGLKVDFGFSPYSERVNGRVAILGLTALLLVELGTGKSVINYHTPAVVLIQVYFVAAVMALFIKYEKEMISVWPPP
ncbi:hypothetical protein CFOL_v3_20728 [Cephalotus follicularis]|uniref:Chloroa_b-bind domain-containing protein n=1 Tax=Cephalotus follicularis TaxID=3775 RepID=A0A1Q3CAJ1_CEPFO|nr:hypothetical protein CFOL_v3_20728 [Cephalotus follicularis]